MPYTDTVKTIPANAGCHKMKVNVRELDNAVLTIIRKQAEIVLGSADLSGFRKKKTNALHTNDCMAQIRQLTRQRQQCYERFICREIDRDTFQSMKAGYAAQIDRLNNQLALLKQAERDKEADAKAASLAKEALSETAAAKDIVNALIDKIFVSPGNHIEIQWKFVNFAVKKETEDRRYA
jgi:hypothetical protein